MAHETTLKKNVIKLSQGIGGPYALVSRGINRSIIQGILKGSLPSVQNAYLIAKVFNVSLENLLTGKDIYFSTVKPKNLNRVEGSFIPLISGPIPQGTAAFSPEKIKGEVWVPNDHFGSMEEGECRYVGVKVVGRDMFPVLSPKETAIIDRKQSDLKHLKKKMPYAVLKNGAIKFAYLILDKEHNSLQFHPSNPDLAGNSKIDIVPLKTFNSNPVLGRVVFSYKSWKGTTRSF